MKKLMFLMGLLSINSAFAIQTLKCGPYEFTLDEEEYNKPICNFPYLGGKLEADECIDSSDKESFEFFTVEGGLPQSSLAIGWWIQTNGGDGVVAAIFEYDERKYKVQELDYMPDHGGFVGGIKEYECK